MINDTADGRPKPRIQSVARAMDILFLVAGQSNRGMSAKEISERLQLTRPTTYHLLQTLVSGGLLTRGDGRRYVLGLGVGTLAAGYSRHLDHPEHFMPFLRMLADRTGEAAVVVGWRDGEIMPLGEVPGRHFVSVSTGRVNQMLNADAFAGNRVLLAYASDEMRHYYMEQKARRVGRARVADMSKLEGGFAAVREAGYATDLEGIATGVCSLAAPLDPRYPHVALAIAAPTERFMAMADEYLESMMDVCRSAASAKVDSED